MTRIVDFLRRTLKTNDRRRHRKAASVSMLSSTEALETRSLLTIGINFDFSVIASDPSPDLRLFGSSDPADAPAQTLRYGQGTLTSLIGFDGGDLLSNPGDITFEFGSQDTANPVVAATLQSFDDGVADGVADQYYESDVGSEMRFFYQGTLFGTSFLNSVSLEVSPGGATTGRGNFGSFLNDSQVPVEDRQPEIQELFYTSFPSDSGYLEFTLDTFTSTGAWAGAPGGESFTSAGKLLSLDNVPGAREFAQTWDVNSPFSSNGRYAGADWLKADLDPTMEYTFQVSSDGPNSTGINVWSGETNLLSTNGSNWDQPFTIIPTTSTTHFHVIADSRSLTYTVELISAKPASLNVSDAGGDLIAWTPEFDDQGNELPADGYRVQVNSGGQLLYEQDVDGTTLQHSLAGQLGLSPHQVTVGRIVTGSVVTVSNPLTLPGVNIRGHLNSLDAGTFTWDEIRGALRYELYLGPGQGTGQATTVSVDDTSYMLSADHPIGWRDAWVRGVAHDLTRGFWSPLVTYHARSAVQATKVDTGSDPLRPVISWTALAGAETYELQVNNLTTGAQNVIHEMLPNTDLSFIPTADLGLGTYQVWVRGINAGLPAAWAGAVTFDVGAKPVSVVAGTSPQRPVFTWSTVPGVQSVDLQIFNAGTTMTISNLSGTTWPATSDFSDGNVTWWVQGIDSAGNRSRWSESQTARIGGTIVAGPTGTLEWFERPSFSWVPVIGAQSYQVFLRKLTGGDDLIFDTTDTSFQLPDQIDGNHYSAWVNTLYGSGANVWSNRIEFDLRPREGRLITTPSGPVATSTPTIQWLGSSSGRETELWIRDLSDDSNSQMLAGFEDSYTFTNPLPQGSYRIWARERFDNVWLNSIVITVSQVETEPDSDQPETLLARLDLSPFAATADDVPLPVNAVIVSDPPSTETPDLRQENDPTVPVTPSKELPEPGDDDHYVTVFESIHELLSELQGTIAPVV